VPNCGGKLGSKGLTSAGRVAARLTISVGFVAAIVAHARADILGAGTPCGCVHAFSCKEKKEVGPVLGWSLYVLINWAIALFVASLAVWALVDCLGRPAGDFTFARRSKDFWTVVLVLAVVLSLSFIVPFMYLPFRGLLSMLAIIAVVYYLGPERQRMGPRRPGGERRRSNRGGW